MWVCPTCYTPGTPAWAKTSFITTCYSYNSTCQSRVESGLNSESISEERGQKQWQHSFPELFVSWLLDWFCCLSFCLFCVCVSVCFLRTFSETFRGVHTPTPRPNPSSSLWRPPTPESQVLTLQPCKLQEDTSVSPRQPVGLPILGPRFWSDLEPVRRWGVLFPMRIMHVPSQLVHYKTSILMESMNVHTKWKMKGDYPTFNETKHKWVSL